MYLQSTAKQLNLKTARHLKMILTILRQIRTMIPKAILMTRRLMTLLSILMILMSLIQILMIRRPTLMIRRIIRMRGMMRTRKMMNRCLMTPPEMARIQMGRKMSLVLTATPSLDQTLRSA